jgi:peptidoglycan/LPS O-acetylase OafA/YrhL
LRALAIVLVLLFHYRLFEHPAWVDRVGAFGWTGVDLFFVLSGFLIARPLLDAIAQQGRFSLRDFYARRALRILPAYFVVLACYFALPQIHEREALPPWWKFLSFTQNLGLDLRSSATFSHAWSLCIEEQFYLLLPLVLLATRSRRRAYLLPLLFALGFVARAIVYARVLSPGAPAFELEWYEWIYYPTWSRLDGLLVGIALAAAYVFRPAFRALLDAQAHRLLAVALLLWVGCSQFLVDPESWLASLVAFPAIAVVYGLLVASALGASCFLARHRSRVTDALARWSYALYLTHKATIHVVQRALAKTGLAVAGNAMFVCCMLASLLVAYALHLAVERPFLRWRERALTARGG